MNRDRTLLYALVFLTNILNFEISGSIDKIFARG